MNSQNAQNPLLVNNFLGFDSGFGNAQTNSNPKKDLLFDSIIRGDSPEQKISQEFDSKKKSPFTKTAGGVTIGKSPFAAKEPNSDDFGKESFQDVINYISIDKSDLSDSGDV